MLISIIVGIGIVYVIGSYVLVGLMLGNGGPAGLGWLMWPFSPLLLPAAVGYGLWRAVRLPYYAIRNRVNRAFA